MRANRNELTDEIFQTYVLLAFSIGAYLFGAQVLLPASFLFLGIVISFILIFVIYVTQAPIYLFLFSFIVGTSHNPMFEYLNVVDPGIIMQALILSFLVLIGLTIIAFKTKTYYTFAICGFLYTCLSTILWLSILNLFVQNSLLDILLTYFSIVIFSGYIIFDTHNLLESPNNTPVTHALQLFLDFINLFINLVKLLRHLKKKE